MTPVALVHFPIDADFAWAMVHTLSGGVDEMEVGGLCVTPAAAESLCAKIDLAIYDGLVGRNIVLYLTEDEAMAIACSGQNCATDSLPKAQRDRLEYWFERWKRSLYAQVTDLYA